MVVSTLGALGALIACSSSSSPAPQAEAGAGCTDTVVNIFNNNPNVACPVDDSGNPASYDVAITATCASQKQTDGDIENGQCFQYLLFQVDQNTAQTSYTKCFYDPGTHAFVGIIYSDGMTDQCGGTSATIQSGTVDPSCTITGLNGGGSGYQSCVPIKDAGGETMVLGTGG
ncbi:MAG TPA: hypothetical protein VHS09_10645 [Polyangiaceae bacterium]|nr:hypothetical protein [Polyangiaceae bacterium]